MNNQMTVFCNKQSNLISAKIKNRRYHNISESSKARIKRVMYSSWEYEITDVKFLPDFIIFVVQPMN